MATEIQIKKRFGIRLSDIRKQKALTQEELAHKAGLDRDTIAFIETGLRYPTAKTLSLIIKALDVPLEKFFESL